MTLRKHHCSPVCLIVSKPADLRRWFEENSCQQRGWTDAVTINNPLSMKIKDLNLHLAPPGKKNHKSYQPQMVCQKWRITLDQHETPYLSHLGSLSPWTANSKTVCVFLSILNLLVIFSIVGNQIPIFGLLQKEMSLWRCVLFWIAGCRRQYCSANRPRPQLFATYTFTLPTVTGSMTNVDVPKWWGAFIFPAHTPDTTKSIHQFSSSSSW